MKVYLVVISLAIALSLTLGADTPPSQRPAFRPASRAPDSAAFHQVPPWPAAAVRALATGTGVGYNAGGARLPMYTSARAAHLAGVGPGAPHPVSSPPSVNTPSPAAGVAPKAADPTGLSVTKTANGSGWTVNLSWNGGTEPYTVSTCTDPSFQTNAKTLAEGVIASEMSTPANSSASLECYAVTDSTTVSQTVQGTGYDPVPTPTTPAITGNNLWWGDSVTFTADNLDPNPQGDLTQMYDIPVRASSASSGSPFATSALFTIPDDARGFYAYIAAHGRTSAPDTAPYVTLSPRGIGPFSNIHGCAYAPQTGHIWIAADGILEEVDIFEHDPVVVTSFTDMARPYISRVSTGGILVCIDAAAPGAVYQINVSSGTRTAYAATTDSGFTRTVFPVGIGLDPDGSVCYIADASAGKIVRIPQNNGSAITDNWGNFTWNFPDPCGIDVNTGHQVIAASADGWDGYTTGQNNTYLYGYTQGVAYSLFVDRDVSTASYFYVNYTNDMSVAAAFNLNPIDGAPAAYHGSLIYGLANGTIAVDPYWIYFAAHHAPQRVVINNGGQTQPYPTPYQSQDRIIQVSIYGWAGRSARLRVIDPPDLSPYVADGGCLQGGCNKVLPFEGNDNYGMTDYGLTLSADGSGASPTLKITFPTGGAQTEVMVYLKVPAQDSGNNFQVEITKCDAYGNEIPKHVAGLSALYTTWKRVYVERDHMFRRGGLLYQDAVVGDTSIVLYKNPDDTPWDNLNPGDKIAIFDATTTYEGPHDEAYVGTITDTGSPPPGAPHQELVTLLTAPGGSPYQLAHAYTASPVGTGYLPDFSQGESAGVGVVYSTVPDPDTGQIISDTAPNQINGPGSAFYDADMRQIEQPYDDAYVEFFAARSGMGAVPYVHWATVPTPAELIAFNNLWWADSNKGVPNHLHLIGIEDADPAGNTIGGSPFASSGSNMSGASFVYVKKIIDQTQKKPGDAIYVDQFCSVHELTHNFSVQGFTTDTYHCLNDAVTPPADGHKCVMYENIAGGVGLEVYRDTPPRFCAAHLLIGGNTIWDVTTSIRGQQDPLPY